MPHDDRDMRVCMRDYVLAHLQNCRKWLLALSCLFCKEQLGLDFYEILYLIIFKKSVETIQVSLASDENNGYCT